MDRIKNKNFLISSATANDIKKIESIIEKANLPPDEIIQHINNFLLLNINEQSIGTIGLEVYDQIAILRSFAILPSHQGKGFGIILFDKIIELAKRINVTEMYLLTESAEKFFSKNGFEKISRSNIPEILENTFEFTTPRCSDAICMRYILDNRAF